MTVSLFLGNQEFELARIYLILIYIVLAPVFVEQISKHHSHRLITAAAV
jgi:hypothetical protein